VWCLALDVLGRPKATLIPHRLVGPAPRGLYYINRMAALMRVFKRYKKGTGYFSRIERAKLGCTIKNRNQNEAGNTVYVIHSPAEDPEPLNQINDNN
jgi:hypothetical protein